MMNVDVVDAGVIGGLEVDLVLIALTTELKISSFAHLLSAERPAKWCQKGLGSRGVARGQLVASGAASRTQVHLTDGRHCDLRWDLPGGQVLRLFHQVTVTRLYFLAPSSWYVYLVMLARELIENPDI